MALPKFHLAIVDLLNNFVKNWENVKMGIFAGGVLVGMFIIPAGFLVSPWWFLPAGIYVLLAALFAMYATNRERYFGK